MPISWNTLLLLTNEFSRNSVGVASWVMMPISWIRTNAAGVGAISWKTSVTKDASNWMAIDAHVPRIVQPQQWHKHSKCSHKHSKCSHKHSKCSRNGSTWHSSCCLFPGIVQPQQSQTLKMQQWQHWQWMPISWNSVATTVTSTQMQCCVWHGSE